VIERGLFGIVGFMSERGTCSKVADWLVMALAMIVS